MTPALENKPGIHPLFAKAVEASHSRPALPVPSNGRVDHAVILVGEAQPSEDRARLANALEGLAGWDILSDAHGEVVMSNGAGTVKWERHTEFLSLTAVGERDTAGDGASTATEVAFARMLDHLLKGHTGTTPDTTEPDLVDPRGAGGLFVRTRVLVDVAVSDEAIHEGRAEADQDVGVIPQALVNGGAIRLSTGLTHGDEGVVEYQALIKPSDIHAISPRRIGRFVQRVLEVETYRLMAYLAVPLMQAIGPRISALEEAVNSIADRAAHDPAPREEADILSSLTNLSAELQALGSVAAYRFAASLAYAAIVDERLEALREQRIEGYQRISTAVKRRLDPAMRSATALLARQQKIAGRIGYISELLRTRVDLTLQDQNAEVLQSIDARAKAQLRLQHAVEGLSVVAITYYSLGILSYLVKGTRWEGLGITAAFVQALIVIPVALFVFWRVRKTRKKAEEEERQSEEKTP